MADEINVAIDAIQDEMVALRRLLHAAPEIAFQEHETAARIASELTSAGLDVNAEIGGTGLVGVIEGDRPGPTLMIRADIDGLPVTELTGLEFASTNGNMHACGHDGHIAIAIGAAKVLAGMRDRLAGKIVFLFQPAEEVVGGANAMIDDNVLRDYPCDRAIGLHLWNQMPVGEIGVNRAAVFASADAIRITVRGRGGHGALPHLAADPVTAAAQIVSAAQTVISREVPPNEMGVLTFGQIHGGVAPNVIPDEVVIEGTIRAYTPETRELIHNSLERLAKQTAIAMKCEAIFERLYGAPPVVNTPEVADWISATAAGVIGPDHVGEVEPVSVGDDMAEFINRVPGCYFLLGASK
ncbi:MAG: amidohydrolase, partial [Chloroflexi bacterium]|nr:amidohydrolase [Chloroflexota bacterium]